jgi:copper chaperone
MKTTIFKIEGMSCDGCANTVKTALEKEAGVQSVAVSFAGRDARVVYDPQSEAEERLVAAIEKPGFRVTARESA